MMNRLIGSLLFLALTSTAACVSEVDDEIDDPRTVFGIPAGDDEPTGPFDPCPQPFPPGDLKDPDLAVAALASLEIARAVDPSSIRPCDSQANSVLLAAAR